MTSSELLSRIELDDFVVIDFETTGLDASTCKIIELGAVRFRDGEPAAEFQQLVNPLEPIPTEIVELTNISDDMVTAEPTIEEVGPEFLDFIGGSPLVAHNIRFDLAFLQGVYRALGRPEKVTNRLYDTITLSRTFLYHHTGFNLAALCDFYGLEHKEAHRAYNDALNTGLIFVQLVHEAAAYPLPVIQSLLGVQQHVDIPNKHLYVRLADVMASTGQTKGLTSSTVEYHRPRATFEHDGRGDDYGPQTAQVFFGEEGTLAAGWEQFESRPIQAEFSEAVARAFEDGQILVAEAGTGLGKSMAYLLPAVNHAYVHRQPVVVSCYTKYLQDQLFYREIPRLVTILDAPVKAVILKGRGNYLCRTRLEFVLANAKRLLGPEDCESILPIIIWELHTLTGDVDECPGFLSHRGLRLWRMLRSERGFCLGNTCRRHHGCFLGPIRRAARQASLIVVNHALLIADAAGEVGLLPEDYVLVLDEAHHLPRVTTEALTMEFGEGIVRRLCDNYLGSRYRQIFRKQLRDALQVLDEEKDWYAELQAAARVLQKATANLLEAYVCENQIRVDPDWKYATQLGRYIDPHLEFRGLDAQVQTTAAALDTLTQMLADTHKLLTKTDMALSESLVNDLELDLSEATVLNMAFKRIAMEEPTGDDVLWREVQARNDQVQVEFRCAPLTVGAFLSGRVFERRPGTVLCSATLQVGTSFDYFRGEAGLDEHFDAWPVEEREFPSPFYYSEQCVVLGWETPVDVTDPQYPQQLAELIDVLTDQIERRLLVLFTSYAQVQAVHAILHPRLFRSQRRLITQFGGSSRRSLLEAFRENPRAILLGTASFWEGIDLPGELLEMLIIARLPFANPTEPVVEARIEYLQEQGYNPFQEYQIPDAITRFRQGFGRLIRTSSDEGLFIIADSRVYRRSYGQLFLDALPVQAIPFRYPDRIASLVEGIVFQPEKA
ncbi:MAG: helicase C-terminal domain-containing protein [Candidatus Neomarinimicrobiota bacterium]